MAHSQCEMADMLDAADDYEVGSSAAQCDRGSIGWLNRIIRSLGRYKK